MSNGFKALRHIGGGVSRLEGYPIADDNTTTIWNGDAVKLVAGEVQQAAATDTGAGVVVGTFLGCNYVDVKGRQQFSPFWDGVAGSSEILAIITEDPKMTFRVVDTAGTLAVGAACVLSDVGSENATIGASTMEVVAGAAQFTVRKILGTNLNGDVEVEVAIGPGV